MRYVSVVNASTGEVLAERATVAETMFARFMGLQGKRALPEGGGLVIDPCTSIHMFFMRFAIDALYVAPNGMVVRVVHRLRPWRVGPISLSSRYVVELPAGTAARTGTEKGDQLRVEPVVDA